MTLNFLLGKVCLRALVPRALSSVSRGVVESSRMQSVAALFAQHVRRDGLRFAEADADGDNVLADAAGCGGGS